MNHVHVVQKAKEFVHEMISEDISVVGICRHANVSRRALEFSFRVCLEESPSAYLRKVRLNEIHRALMRPANADRPIGDIAAEFGVWRLSRFAQYYKQHFGQLPSQTRKLIFADRA